MLSASRYRPKEYDLEDGPWDPISGGASALLGTLASLVVGAAVIPTDIIRALKLTPAHLRRPHDARELDSMDERCDLVSKEFSKAQGSDQASPRGPLHSFKYKSMIDTQTKNSKIKTANRAKAEKEGHSFFNKMVRISTKTRTSTRDSSAVPKDCSSDATTSTRCLSPGPNTTSPQEDQGNLGTSHTECQYASKFALEKVSGRQNSVGRVLISGLKFPMDFILHVAKGFHNAPQLYGDTSVRPLHKIEGLKSGLEASARVSLPLPSICQYGVVTDINRNSYLVSTTAQADWSCCLSEAGRQMALPASLGESAKEVVVWF